MAGGCLLTSAGGWPLSSLSAYLSVSSADVPVPRSKVHSVRHNFTIVQKSLSSKEGYYITDHCRSSTSAKTTTSDGGKHQTPRNPPL